MCVIGINYKFSSQLRVSLCTEKTVKVIKQLLVWVFLLWFSLHYFGYVT